MNERKNKVTQNKTRTKKYYINPIDALAGVKPEALTDRSIHSPSQNPTPPSLPLLWLQAKPVQEQRDCVLSRPA
jgi:hypothetical protein